MRNFVSIKNQQGAALPMVLILMVLMIILSAAAYQVSQGNTGLIAMAASSEKAFYAAEQGYNRTLWRLNEKPNFLTDDDPNPDKIEYPTTSGNFYNRYELTPASNYRVHVLVPLETVAGNEVEDNYRRIIRSTGWDNRYPERLRSIEAEVYKKTFTQFCMANNSERAKNGNPLYWLSGEVIYGPLHTNDTLYVKGTPVFHGPVTYVNGIDIEPAENMYNPAIFRKGNSKVAETLSFSSSLSNLKAQARIDGHYYNGRACIRLLEDGGYNIRYYDRNTNGWYYNGIEYRFIPTIDGNQPGLSNKWYDSELAQEKADKGFLWNHENCVMFQRVIRNADGTLNEAVTNLPENSFRSFAEFVSNTAPPPIDLPNNGVIYVDGGTGANDSTGVSKYNRNLGNVFISGKLDGRLTIAAANDIFITAHDPCDWKRPDWGSNWDWSDWWDNPAAGVTYSKTTFEQKFDASGEWTHTEVGGDSGEDMLGLVATNYVTVLHYNWPSQYHNVRCATDLFGLAEYDDYCWKLGSFIGNIFNIPKDHAPDNIYLYAAIYAQEESFGFEAYYQDQKKDTAYLVGSIAQKYRGPMGVSGFFFGGGYKKNYSHDPRFLYDAPPHYPDPANSGWQTSRWDEIKNHIN